MLTTLETSTSNPPKEDVTNTKIKSNNSNFSVSGGRIRFGKQYNLTYSIILTAFFIISLVLLGVARILKASTWIRLIVDLVTRGNDIVRVRDTIQTTLKKLWDTNAHAWTVFSAAFVTYIPFIVILVSFATLWMPMTNRIRHYLIPLGYRAVKTSLFYPFTQVLATGIVKFDDYYYYTNNIDLVYKAHVVILYSNVVYYIASILEIICLVVLLKNHIFYLYQTNVLPKIKFDEKNESNCVFPTVNDFLRKRNLSTPLIFSNNLIEPQRWNKHAYLKRVIITIFVLLMVTFMILTYSTKYITAHYTDFLKEFSKHKKYNILSVGAILPGYIKGNPYNAAFLILFYFVIILIPLLVTILTLIIWFIPLPTNTGYKIFNRTILKYILLFFYEASPFWVFMAASIVIRYELDNVFHHVFDIEETITICTLTGYTGNCGDINIRLHNGIIFMAVYILLETIVVNFTFYFWDKNKLYFDLKNINENEKEMEYTPIESDNEE